MRQFEELEPFGQWRDNWHAALIAYILASAHRDPKKRAPELADFFYKDPQTVADERDAQTVAMFRNLAKKGNGQ